MFVLAFDRNHVLLNLIKFSLLNCHTLEHAKVPGCITKRSMHHHSCFFGSDLPMISDLLRAPCRVASPCASPETRLLPSESQRHSEGRKQIAGRVKHLVQLVQLNLKLDKLGHIDSPKIRFMKPPYFTVGSILRLIVEGGASYTWWHTVILMVTFGCMFLKSDDQ